MTQEIEPAKKPLKIILDSNAFFVPLKFKIDIFEELKTLLNGSVEFVLLSPIWRELRKFADKGSPKARKEASYALKMAEKCRLVELNESFTGPPDDIVVQMADKWKCPVFTNDKELRKRLRDINVPVIYVRQKSRLEIDGRI